MTYTEFTNEVLKLYNAKIKTGLYDEYPQEALDMLLEDCMCQVACMNAINERSAKRND